MTHGDDAGLMLPPRLAPIQARQPLDVWSLVQFSRCVHLILSILI